MDETTKEITIIQDRQVVEQTDIFFDPERFEHAQRVAKIFTGSSMVPQHFKGDQNIGNVLIAMNYASRVKADIFMVLQNMYVIHGKPGIETKLAIAPLNSSGRFTPLKYRYNDKKTECIAYATDCASKELCEGVTVSLEMAHKEGWMGKQGSKWKTMPELMLMYRSAIFFIRAYAPDVLLGMRSKEELVDMKNGAIDITPENATTNDLQKIVNKQKGQVIDKKEQKEPVSEKKQAEKVKNGTETDKNQTNSEWLPESYKNMRAGKFDILDTADKWTGFARYIFDNRMTWTALSNIYKGAVKKKWEVLYKGLPFILDNEGNLIATKPEVKEQTVTENIADDIQTTNPPDMEGTVSIEDVLNHRKTVADGKIKFPDIFNDATTNLISGQLIRHADISSMTYNECENVLTEMNRIMDLGNTV